MASILAMRTPAEEFLIAEAYKAAGANDNGTSMRRTALQKFEDTGLPHRRIEEWKYTDLRSFWRESLPVAAKPDAEALGTAAQLAGCLPAGERLTLSFVDGFLVETPTLPQGVEVIALETALSSHVPFPSYLGMALHHWDDRVANLNTAFLQAGAIVKIRKSLAQLLHLDFRYTQAAASYPRIVILCEDGVDVSILETLTGIGQHYVCNQVIEIFCGDEAKLTHLRLQEQAQDSIQLTTTAATLGHNSNYTSFTLENGAGFVRTQTFLRQTGRHAQINLSGVSLIKGRQHCDTTLVADHAAPEGISRELFKYVIADEGRGVFQGKVIVQPGAQKTDGKMSARGLLLSDNAEFDAKPELEIYADDVLCAHGATAGALDEDLLFYLRARGLSEGEAKALLVAAFIGEGIETVEDETLREMFMQRATAWLQENLH